MWRLVIGIGIAIAGTCYAVGEEGVASVYSEGQTVACGGRLTPSAMTAAHKSLPCGSKVKVTNKSNGKS
jgi:rare lipoprotein A